jgi:hypothetical protein
MTRAEAEAAVKQHGGQRGAAAALGVGRRTIRTALAGGRHPSPAPAKPSSATHIKGVRSLAEFRQTYDHETIVPSRVNAALKELGAGWLYEVEFAKLANVTTTQLSMFRDRYAEHIVSVRDSRRKRSRRCPAKRTASTLNNRPTATRSALPCSGTPSTATHIPVQRTARRSCASPRIAAARWLSTPETFWTAGRSIRARSLSCATWVLRPSLTALRPRPRAGSASSSSPAITTLRSRTWPGSPSARQSPSAGPTGSS